MGPVILCHVIKKIRKIQNKAVNLLSPKIFIVQNIDECYIKNQLLDISKTRDYQVSIFTYKYLHNLLSSSFENIFSINSDLLSNNTRGASNLLYQFRKTTRVTFAIGNFAPCIWDIIHVAIRNASHLVTFKATAKRFFLAKE
jgi:hypothetical protein